jgi:hypothetical protein
MEQFAMPLRAILPRLATLWLATLFLPTTVNAQDKPPDAADLVLLNGKVVTMDDRRPEASAIVIRGDRIVEVGDDRAARRWIGRGTRVIDLAHRLALPGFIDSHAHIIDLGESKMGMVQSSFV